MQKSHNSSDQDLLSNISISTALGTEDVNSMGIQPITTRQYDHHSKLRAEHCKNYNRVDLLHNL
jgi:hypothetical protein